MRTAIIIPAAGNSSRMGSEKASMDHREGLTFAGYLVSEYSRLGIDPVILVVNRSFDLSSLKGVPVRFVINDHVHLGRSHSVRLGIHKVPEGHSCLIQNVDNPFVDNRLLEGMISLAKPDHYIVPVCHGHGGHPILLGSSIVDHLRNMDVPEDFKGVLDKFSRAEFVFPDEKILLNVNTPADYEAFCRSF